MVLVLELALKGDVHVSEDSRRDSGQLLNRAGMKQRGDDPPRREQIVGCSDGEDRAMIVAFLTICLGWAASAPAAEAVAPSAHPDSKHWDNLFKEDLSDAIFPAGAGASTSGVLSATKDEDLWTKREYHNCIIDLEFNNDPGANSGLFVYRSDIEKQTLNSVEVQILDDFSPSGARSPRRGSAAASSAASRPPRAWSRNPANGTA